MLSPHLLGSVLESAPDAIIVIDSAGIIAFANRQVSALFGYETAEILGRDVELLLPTRFRARHIEHRKHYTDTVRTRPMGSGMELFGLHKDGHEFSVEISLSPIRDADRVLVAAAIRDVTERKRAQQELTLAREAAERANLAKTRFLATASHDLRQPLQSLALLNGTLRRLATDQVTVEAIEQQDHAIESMSRLLNALLDISKLESGAIRPGVQDFGIADLLEELRREFAALAASKALDFRVDTAPCSVRSDPELLRQILRNLVSNAIKYTRSGAVYLRCIELPDAVRIEVADTGVGIAEEQLSYIFDEFYQIGVPSNASREGYGLGLSIVKRLVDLLSIRLDVTSIPGKGTCFSLGLPTGDRAELPSAASAVSKQSAASALSNRVLLVEDDHAVRDATRLLLRVEGYRVTAASSLAEAVELARQNLDISLIVSDYHLSANETGLHVVQAVRRKLGRQIGAILITGDTSAAIREIEQDNQLRLASKPINADELLSLVRDLHGT